MKTNLEMPDLVYLTMPRPAPKRKKRWTPNEEVYLRRAVHRGDSLPRICDLLGRPYSGVLSKLCQIRYVGWNDVKKIHEWNTRKVPRQDFIARTRDPQISFRREDIPRMYEICCHIALLPRPR